MPEGIWEGQFNIVAGQADEEGPYAAVTPHRTVAESTADLYVALQPTRPDTDALCGELMQTIGRVFGRSQYSVTGNLLLAMGRAHQHLREWNRASMPEHRLGVGVTCVAIAGNTAYVAQAGPAAAFHRHTGRVDRLAPQDPDALAPLGESDTFAPHFLRLELDRGDALLLLSDGLAAHLDRNLIEQCLTLEPMQALPEIYRAAQRERDCGAVLLAVTGDLPNGDGGESDGSEVVGHSIAVPRAGRDQQGAAPPDDVARRRPPSPMPRNPFRRANAAHPDDGDGVLRVLGAELPKNLGGERRKPRRLVAAPEELLAAAAAAFSGTPVRMKATHPSFRGAFSSLGGRRPVRPWLLAGGGVVAVVLLFWLGVPALASSGRSQQYTSLLRSAQTEFASAQTENDPAHRRELLNQALSNADEAKRLRPNDPRVESTAGSVQDALTVMDAVYMLPDIPTLADLSSAGLASSSAVEVAAGDRYYVLDIAAGKVFAAARDPNAPPELRTAVVFEDGSQVDGVRAGKAQHIAWQPPAGATDPGTLLILDASRHLFGLSNGDLRAVPLRGVEQWHAATAMAVAGDTLYVLDAPAGLVWRYGASDSGFDTDPAPYVARADIRDASGLSVVGGIFLTGQDSRIRRFLEGQEAPFTLAGIDKPPASPTPPLFDPASGLLYIADRADNRVVVLEGDGRFKRQLVHQRLAGLRGVAVDAANNRLVGVIGQALVAIPLP